MSYRRRHRWFRRMALGLAFSLAMFAGRASVASAKIDEGTKTVQVIPYLSHGMLTEADVQAAAAEAIHDPFLTDIFVRQGESLGGPDGDAVAFANAIQSQQPTVIPYLSHGILGEDVKSQEVAAVRPDDLANRFAHSDVAPRPELASSGSTVEWSNALTVGISALVLALGLGLAVGYLRRPRLAGL